jgi:hypothetical protein
MSVQSIRHLKVKAKFSLMTFCDRHFSGYWSSPHHPHLQGFAPLSVPLEILSLAKETPSPQKAHAKAELVNSSSSQEHLELGHRGTRLVDRCLSGAQDTEMRHIHTDFICTQR